MKVRPKSSKNYTTAEHYEEYANSIGVNPEELDGLHEIRIFPKRYMDRKFYSEFYGALDELENDLYDDDVALQTRRDNKDKITFTEKIPLTEYDKLTEEQKIGYHAFLCDYKEDND